MSAVVTPVAQTIYTAVVAFVTSVLGTSVPVVQGLGNRAAMPLPGFVAVTFLYQDRVATNYDSWTGADPSSIAAQQGLKVAVQIDCYGPTSGDWAAMLTTLWRDEYACNLMAPSCQPLYADNARQMPLIDSEAQYESRYTIDAQLMYNPVTTFPMEFADSLDQGVINVNAAFPPT
jgi:hypothetical protein